MPGHHASPQPKASVTLHPRPSPPAPHTIGVDVAGDVYLVLALVGSLIFAFVRCKSEQGYSAAATMIAALIALFFVPTSDILHVTVVIVGALVILFFGIRSIQIAEDKEQQRAAERRGDMDQAAWLRTTVDGLRSAAENHDADLKTALTVLAAMNPVTGAGRGVQSRQTMQATGTVQFVLWPEEQTLRAQVVDLINNCRRAAEALRITPDDQYVKVLAIIAEPFVGPSIVIRQALRRVIGYPEARPLDHLPPGTTALEYDTIAEAHERLLRLIPSDAPAVPLESYQ